MNLLLIITLMDRFLLFLLGVMALTIHLVVGTRHIDLTVGSLPIVNANDTIHIRGDYMLILLDPWVLPCNVALVGDTPDALLSLWGVRFGQPSDAGTIYCDVHLSNLTLDLRHQHENLLDTSVTHYYRMHWHNVTLIGNVSLLADGGELDANNCTWTSRSNVTVSRMTVVHMRNSACIGCTMRLHDNDVLNVTHTAFSNASVALIYEPHPHIFIPRIADLLHNTVARSKLSIRCAQADIKTSSVGGGLASFDVQDDTVVGRDCFIDYETRPPSVFYNTAFVPLNFAL